MLTTAQAAERLGIGIRQLYLMIRQGQLIPVFPDGPKKLPHLREEDVSALADARLRRPDLPSIVGMAQAAYALSRSTSEKLEKICSFLGIESGVLSYEEDDIVSFLLEIEEAMEKETAEMPVDEVVDWARKLRAVDEHYLMIVAKRTSDTEPWRPFFMLAHKIMVHAPRHKFIQDKNLASAYGMMELARNQLRYVAYFYIRLFNGKRQADKIFRDPDIDEQMINQLFPSPDL